MSPAISLILSGIFFAISHASVKLLPHLPTTEIVFFRAMFSVTLSYVWLRSAGIRPWGRNKPMLLLRGFFGTLALLLYFYTLKHMPLATAVTLNYMAPVFTMLLGWLWLREAPAWYHWFFIALSFVGVLLVHGFDARVTGIGAAAGIGAALAAAVAYSLVRKLKDEDHPLVVVFYFPLVTLPLILPFASGWSTPRFSDWPVLAVIGVFTQVAQYFMTRAFQGAPAASITNLNYLTILYALVIGRLFFGEELAPAAFFGIALIVISAALSARFAPTAPATVVNAANAAKPAAPPLVTTPKTGPIAETEKDALNQ